MMEELHSRDGHFKETVGPFFYFFCRKSGIFRDFSTTELLISPGLLMPCAGCVGRAGAVLFAPAAVPGLTLGCREGEDMYVDLKPKDGVLAGVVVSSKPVAMTVMVQVSDLVSSYMAPKMILTSSPASS